MRVFGDAISIWEDIEVRAYTQALSGEYIRRWAPPGATHDQIPAVLSVPLALPTRELSPVAQDLDPHNAFSTDDIVVAHIALNASRWLLMFTRVVDPAAMNRLSLYVDVLEQSLKQLTVSGTLHLCRAVWDRLLTGDDNPARAADAALADIVRAVDGTCGALLVTFPHGGHALSAGAIDRFSNLHTPDPRASLR